MGTKLDKEIIQLSRPYDFYPYLTAKATCCLLDHHEMRLGPKKTAAPEVDLLSSTADAQSASQKPLIGSG